MKPLVSICCITYNHAPYIRDALDGFLMQKTNFPFEIVIHDDASTDGTQDIIREYERENPKIFNVIYQKENQYSQGINIDKKYVIPRLRGKYTASCEGDDYWFDPNKLQLQADYLEKHDECVCTFHPVVWLDYSKGGRVCSTDQRWYTEGNLDVDFVILEGHDIATCSMVYRTNIYKKLPYFMDLADVGDYPLVCYMITRGGFHYFPNIMATYRWRTGGSWSNRYLRDKTYVKKHYLISLTWLCEYNRYTKWKYVALIGKKMWHYIDGLDSECDALLDYPWIADIVVNAVDRTIRLKELEQLAKESNDDKIKQQYRNEELEYWTWFVGKIEEGVK